MKKALHLLLAATVVAFASCTPKVYLIDASKPFEFSMLDSVPGTKAELFVRANEWMAKSYASAKDVIQMSDKEAGKIVGKGTFTTPTTHDALGLKTTGVDDVTYTIVITVKDNRYKCEFSDFIHTGGYGYSSIANKQIKSESFGNIDGYRTNAKWVDDVKYIGKYNVDIWLKSLSEAMHKKTDNW